MNDNTKVLDQNPVSASHVQPSAPVGVANKEIGPTPSVISEIRHEGPEVKHEISQELKELGVEERKDKPDLTFEHQQSGVDHAGPDVIFPSSPSGKVKLPMSEEDIAKQLKTGQDDDSDKWLARLINKVISVMELKVS